MPKSLVLSLTDQPEKPAGRPWIRWVGTIIALALIVYLLNNQGWEEIWEAVRRINLGRFLLARLDGEHTRDALLEELQQLADDGFLVLKGNAQQTEAEAHAVLGADLDEALAFLLQAALLER